MPPLEAWRFVSILLWQDLDPNGDISLALAAWIDSE